MKVPRLLSLALASSLLALAVALPAGSQNAKGHAEFRYQVEIVNITRAQQLTPLLLVIHRPSVGLFSFGQPASGPYWSKYA